MYSCTFFGDADCPESIEDILRKTIIELITRENVTCFYVGNNGRLDLVATRVLKELQNYCYDIDIFVTLAYFPRNDAELYDKFAFYPFLTENVPDREAIDYRDDYMLDNSEYVIAYTAKDTGTAAKYVNKAIRQKKKIINLADLLK